MPDCHPPVTKRVRIATADSPSDARLAAHVSAATGQTDTDAADRFLYIWDAASHGAAIVLHCKNRNGTSIGVAVHRFQNYCYQSAEPHTRGGVGASIRAARAHFARARIPGGASKAPAAVLHSARHLHGYEGPGSGAERTPFIRWDLPSEAHRTALVRAQHMPGAPTLCELHVAAHERFMYDTGLRVGTWMELLPAAKATGAALTSVSDASHRLTHCAREYHCGDGARIAAAVRALPADAPPAVGLPPRPPLRVLSFVNIVLPAPDGAAPVARWDARLARLRGRSDYETHLLMHDGAARCDPVRAILFTIDCAGQRTCHAYAAALPGAADRPDVTHFADEADMIDAFLHTVLGRVADLLVAWRPLHEYDADHSVQYLVRRMCVLRGPGAAPPAGTIGRLVARTSCTWGTLSRAVRRDRADEVGVEGYAPSAAGTLGLVPHVDLFDVQQRKYARRATTDLAAMHRHVAGTRLPRPTPAALGRHLAAAAANGARDAAAAWDHIAHAFRALAAAPADILLRHTSLLDETLHMATLARVGISDVWGRGPAHAVEARVLAHLAALRRPPTWCAESQAAAVEHYVASTAPALAQFAADCGLAADGFTGGLCLTDPATHTHTGAIATLDFSGYYPALMDAAALCYTNVLPVAPHNAAAVAKLVHTGRAYTVDLAATDDAPPAEVAYVVDPSLLADGGSDGGSGDAPLDAAAVQTLLRGTRARCPLVQVASNVAAERALIKSRLAAATSTLAAHERDELAVRDSVLKRFANSVFGALGQRHGRVCYNPATAAAVALWGRSVISAAVHAVARCARVDIAAGRAFAVCRPPPATANLTATHRLECVHVDTDGMDMRFVALDPGAAAEGSPTAAQTRRAAQAVGDLVTAALAHFDPTAFPAADLAPETLRDGGVGEEPHRCLFAAAADTGVGGRTAAAATHASGALRLSVESVASSVLVLRKKQRAVRCADTGTVAYHGLWGAGIAAPSATARVYRAACARLLAALERHTDSGIDDDDDDLVDALQTVGDEAAATVRAMRRLQYRGFDALDIVRAPHLVRRGRYRRPDIAYGRPADSDGMGAPDAMRALHHAHTHRPDLELHSVGQHVRYVTVEGKRARCADGWGTMLRSGTRVDAEPYAAELADELRRLIEALLLPRHGAVLQRAADSNAPLRWILRQTQRLADDMEDDTKSTEDETRRLNTLIDTAHAACHRCIGVAGLGPTLVEIEDADTSAGCGAVRCDDGMHLQQLRRAAAATPTRRHPAHAATSIVDN